MHSPKRPPCISDNQEIQQLAKNVLVNRLFLGSYLERRYVDVLRDYRDVVVVSPAETQLLSELEKVREKMLKFFGVKWVGITEPGFAGAPAGYCFWVKIKNLPFGQYWFQIRQVKFEEGEILLRLKSIRPVSSQDQLPTTKSTTSENESESSIPVAPDSSNEYHFDFDPGETIDTMWKNIKDTSQQVVPLLTRQNLILVLKLMVAMIIALITVMLAFVRNLGEYFLRLLREVSLFINVSTPIILQCIDLVTKSIGGLYILLAMMWRGQPVNRPPRPFPNQQRMLPPSVNNFPSPPPNWRERNRLLKEQLLNR